MKPVRFDTSQCSEELKKALRGNSRVDPIGHRLTKAVYLKSTVLAHFRMKLKKYADYSNMQKHLPRWERCIEEVKGFK